MQLARVKKIKDGIFIFQQSYANMIVERFDVHKEMHVLFQWM